MRAGFEYLSLLAALIAVGVAGCNNNPSSNQQPASAAPRVAFAIPPQFAQAYPFKEGVAAVEVGEILTGKWGFIDKSGNFVLPPQCDMLTRQSSFSDGLAAVLVGGIAHGKWGFIDKQGRFVINPQFSAVWSGFVDGFASVQVEERASGIIDKHGNFLVPPIFDFTSEFSEGLAAVSFNEGNASHPQGVQYVNSHGNVVLVPKAQIGADFHDGLAFACILNGRTYKCGYIDKHGTFVISPVYDIVDDFNEGYARVGLGTTEAYDRGDAKFGFIDKKGNVVVPFNFSEASNFSEGRAAVRIGDRWGFITTDGVFVVNPTFVHLGSYAVGLAAASADGKKWGFIDKSGRFVIDPIYDGVEPFSEGLVLVYVNDKIGYIKRPTP